MKGLTGTDACDFVLQAREEPTMLVGKLAPQRDRLWKRRGGLTKLLGSFHRGTAPDLSSWSHGTLSLAEMF